MVNGISQGCSALPSYVTGDGSGQTLQIITFNDGTTASDTGAGPTYSGIFSFDPAGSRTEPQFDNTGYLSVSPGNQIILDFSSPIDYFGLDWASPNAGDTLTLNQVTNGQTTLLIQYAFSFTSSADQYVYANAVGITFNEVVLASGSVCCFETDNHSFVSSSPVAVPEPGTGSTLPGGAIGLLALYAFVRRASSTATPRSPLLRCLRSAV